MLTGPPLGFSFQQGIATFYLHQNPFLQYRLFLQTPFPHNHFPQLMTIISPSPKLIAEMHSPCRLTQPHHPLPSNGSSASSLTLDAETRIWAPYSAPLSDVCFFFYYICPPPHLQASSSFKNLVLYNWPFFIYLIFRV